MFMAADYDYDALILRAHIKSHGDIKVTPSYPYIDIESVGTTVLSVTSSTLPNKDIVFIYRTSDGTTTRVVCNSTATPPIIDRFQQIILELEE
jgi:hypothetical protein